jgi:hypothetical protein
MVSASVMSVKDECWHETRIDGSEPTQQRRLVVTTRHAGITALCAAALTAAWLTAGRAQHPDAQPRPFTGGRFEASGVAAVPGTDGVLFVDDNRTREVFYMEVGRDGAQRPSPRSRSMPTSKIPKESQATAATSTWSVRSRRAGDRTAPAWRDSGSTRRNGASRRSRRSIG